MQQSSKYTKQQNQTAVELIPSSKIQSKIYSLAVAIAEELADEMPKEKPVISAVSSQK